MKIATLFIRYDLSGVYEVVQRHATADNMIEQYAAWVADRLLPGAAERASAVLKEQEGKRTLLLLKTFRLKDDISYALLDEKAILEAVYAAFRENIKDHFFQTMDVCVEDDWRMRGYAIAVRTYLKEKDAYVTDQSPVFLLWKSLDRLTFFVQVTRPAPEWSESSEPVSYWHHVLVQAGRAIDSHEANMPEMRDGENCLHCLHFWRCAS